MSTFTQGVAARLAHTIGSNKRLVAPSVSPMANGGVAGDGGFRKGDIVRLKRGFDRTLEAIGAHRAGLPLKEGALFEILDCEPGEMSIVLILREVYVVHIAGAR